MFQLPELPYSKMALEPFMSSRTFDFHYDKHHKAYVDNLNKLLGEWDGWKNQTLEDLIKISRNDSSLTAIFNNAAQIYNHNFFWMSMTSPSLSRLKGRIFDLLCRDFKSIDQFKTKFSHAGLTQFGSGWVWLCFNHQSNTLEIIKTANADTPITQDGITPLLTCDVWEHAYYIDYQNRRGDFIHAFLEHLINWDRVNHILEDLGISL